MSINPIAAIAGFGSGAPDVSGVSGLSGLTGLTGTQRTGVTGEVSPVSFADLAGSIDSLQALQANATELGIKAVTGDLDDVHDYTIAASQASVALELTVAMRNKAVEAFTEIMRMQA